MTTIINTAPLTPSYVELDLSWSPASIYTYTAPNGTVLTGPSAAVNIDITFTAQVAIDNSANDISAPLTIVEHRWDFGDGIVGFGPTVHHTYKLANFQARATLRVTDSIGRQWFAQHPVYLRAGGGATCLDGLTMGELDAFTMAALDLTTVGCGGGGCVAPIAVTNPASGVTITGATLSGSINPEHCATNFQFDYGLTTGYGSTTTLQSAGSGTTTVTVTQAITGLSAHTTYHYRITATNTGGTTNGADGTFTTGGSTHLDGTLMSALDALTMTALDVYTMG